MTLQDSFRLFGRLASMSRASPRGNSLQPISIWRSAISNQDTEQLMANINAARTIILTGYSKACAARKVE